MTVLPNGSYQIAQASVGSGSDSLYLTALTAERGTPLHLAGLGASGRQIWPVERRVGSGNYTPREAGSRLHPGFGSDPEPGAAVSGVLELFEWELSEPGNASTRRWTTSAGKASQASRGGLLLADDHFRTSTDYPRLVTATPPTDPLCKMRRFNALRLD
ncbi:hypothetical protein ACGFT2_01920 [Streptomyces sp. NPDC048514]|uniref:hypothetical protein n=1 Tax=Streptomyces sp. NPDC048514 TaxID=3365564 RepID=UPI0037241711